MRNNLFLMLTIGLSAFIFSTTASAQQKFTVSLNGVQENPPVNSPGRGSCVLTLNTAETQITLNCTYSGLGSNASAAHIHTDGPAGVNGPVLFNLTGASGTSGTLNLAPTSVTPAQVADLRAKRWYVNIHTTNFPGGEIRGQIKIATTPSDFDGDGRTDIRVLRPSHNGFYIFNSVNNSMTFSAFAGSGVISSSHDDYDGDGRSDLVTFAALGTNRVWRILQSGSNTVREVLWGQISPNDRIVPADYDGDGKSDIALYRRSEGRWYIIRSSDNQMQVDNWGLGPNDLGIAGDFDKDGKSDLTTVRNTANGFAWFTHRSSNATMDTVFWGGAAAPASDLSFVFAQIDIDGDGRQDHMVLRDPNGEGTPGAPVTYFIRRSSDGQMFVLQWGLDTDTPLFGDYDGDGKTDIVARRNQGGQLVWYIYQSSNGQLRAVQFGAAGDF
ncbi:MAG: CHRD domain-containing protein [Acidobacteriota bacterium]|nr:CHRD domain-containing protein [Acidobacteriota bacterium]